MAVIRIFSSTHFSYAEQREYWLWYATCSHCKDAEDDLFGENWYEKDPETDRFGRRAWQECLDMSLNHLKERHG